jgi:hypothetical protein
VIQKLIKEKIEKKEDKSSLCTYTTLHYLILRDSEVLLDELELNHKSSDKPIKRIMITISKMQVIHMLVQIFFYFKNRLINMRVELKLSKKEMKLKKEITRYLF